MLLMVEKGMRGEICHSIYRYAKANNKYMKDYDKNNVMKHVFMKLMFNIRKNYMNFIMI